MKNKKDINAKVIRYDKVFEGTDQEQARAFIEVHPGQVEVYVTDINKDFDPNDFGTKELNSLKKAFDEANDLKGKFNLEWDEEIAETISKVREKKRAARERAKKREEAKEVKEDPKEEVEPGVAPAKGDENVKVTKDETKDNG